MKTVKTCLKACEWIRPLPPPDEAEQAGVEYAKKWIDDVKPDLRL